MTVKEFMEKVKAVNERTAEGDAKLNEQWEKIKAELPEGDREAAEAEVRVVLDA